ncbi:MAG: hypothetical protein CFE39_08215 [Comamonadaceae bacterium PBBC2]|nr:MAG: hypothetical protein CFE39_08215 [Comamonadaceae bacterium PBBC2]
MTLLEEIKRDFLKLLFVENRYATWVYAAVAQQLEKLGHQIHWLVQNPVFKPAFGCVHIMPFPSNLTGKVNAPVEYEWLARTDRGVLHFGATGAHYPHYDEQVREHLQRIKPDVIFGEATEFHELLVIRHAKAMSIRYLSPNVTRYPADRLAFFAYDTLQPVGGDGSQLSDAESDRMLEEIRQRRVVPSYMRPNVSTPRNLPLSKLADKIRITWGWLCGERYITPSPLRKLALNAAQKKARAQWEAQAAAQIGPWTDLKTSKTPWVLYALQMQPEGNIDVWGSPWNDQAEIIRRAAASLAAVGATLVVKPNPKSKYEMNERLSQVVCSTPNVVALPHATPMAEVFPFAPLVLSVTGTILMECIFSGKPVACLGKHAMAHYPGVTQISKPEFVAEVLQSAERGLLAVATAEEARNLLQKLHSSSYSAAIWDPVTKPDFGNIIVVESLTTAFHSVIELHK